MPAPVRLRLEPLEDRRTPATLIDGKTVTFTDADGDAATVTFSRPVLTEDNFGHVFVFDTGLLPGDNTAPQQLRRLDLSALPAGLSVTAKAAIDGGDGFVHVGFINATGKDVGTVNIAGDLGRIVAGDANAKTPGLRGLSVGSLGAQGLLTQEAGGSLVSVVIGALGSLKVVGDVAGASVSVTGDKAGKIGTVRIGGSLSAAPAVDSSGLIDASGSIGVVTVGGDVVGLDQPNSGVRAGGTLGPVTIKGDLKGGIAEDTAALVGTLGVKGVTIGTAAAPKSILGGIGARSASITATDGNVGRVVVTGDVTGGPGTGSATVLAGNLNGKGGKVVAVTVTGAVSGAGVDSASIIGVAGVGAVRVGNLTGTGPDSARIATGGKLVKLTVDGDIAGGAGDGSAFVTAATGVGSVAVGGNVTGAGGRNSAGIQVANGNIGPVRVGGDLKGGAGDYSAAVQAYGTQVGETVKNGRIASVTVVGDVRGGTGRYSAAVYADDRIGRVTIGTPAGAGGLVGAGPFSATITAGATGIGPVTIRGDIQGGAGDFSGSINTNGKLGPVTVRPNGTASGNITGGAGKESASIGGTAIARVSVAGSVAGAAGQNSASILADLAIGLVSVAGTWTGASIAAGVDVGVDELFGTADDERTAAGVITGITIAGTADGTGANATDHFGFTAGHIKSLKVNGTAVPLTPGPANDTTATDLGTTGDFVAVELAPVS